MASASTRRLLDRVFDPFVSTKRDGVGLGLVNAKAVVEGHGGRIRLTARHPQGDVRVDLDSAAGIRPDGTEAVQSSATSHG